MLSKNAFLISFAPPRSAPHQTTWVVIVIHEVISYLPSDYPGCPPLKPYRVFKQDLGARRGLASSGFLPGFPNYLGFSPNYLVFSQ